MPPFLKDGSVAVSKKEKKMDKDNLDIVNRKWAQIN